MIIEVHGMQHYKQSFTKLSYEKQIKIDKEKRDNAMQNNVSHYIEIDARYSDMEFIRMSIMNNELSNIIDMSNIKWELCNEAGCNSIMKMVCDYWENNKDVLTTNDVAKYFQIDRCTVASYLKRGVINGWCKYNPREELLKTQKNNAHKIDYDIIKKVCNDWNDGFGVLEISEKYRLSKTTTGSYLRYGNENDLCNYSISEARKRGNTKSLTSSRQVNVYKDGKYIMSETNARILSEMSLEKLGIKLCRSNIAAVCARNRKQHHGFEFRYDDDDEFKLQTK